MGSSLTLIVIPLFLYLAPVVLLCVKIADRTSWKVGWLFAPASLLTIGALYDSGVW